MTDRKFDALMDAAATANRPCIAFFQDSDGNWRGAYARDGLASTVDGSKNPTVFARQVGPETVLQMLLTHDGK